MARMTDDEVRAWLSDSTTNDEWDRRALAEIDRARASEARLLGLLKEAVRHAHLLNDRAGPYERPDSEVCPQWKDAIKAAQEGTT